MSLSYSWKDEEVPVRVVSTLNKITNSSVMYKCISFPDAEPPIAAGGRGWDAQLVSRSYMRESRRRPYQNGYFCSVLHLTEFVLCGDFICVNNVA